MGKILTSCSVCGKPIYRWPSQLRSFRPMCSAACRTRSAAGSVPRNAQDLVGRRYGLLTVFSRAGTRDGHALWNCRCDCGGVKVVTTGMLNYGVVRSCGCLKYAAGRDHANWTGGTTVTRDGYREVHVAGSKAKHRYRSEHRLVAERFLGRVLDSREVVHHINGNRLDNRPENLAVMSRSEHAALHAAIRRKERPDVQLATLPAGGG